MPSTAPTVAIETNVELPTWFGLGGRAQRLARPKTVAELRTCIEMDPALRVLGDGANLLVADEGVPELVVSLGQGEFVAIGTEPAPPSSVLVRAGSGVNLPKLILETQRLGLTGLEGLTGIPATVGGAAVMNAGGKYGAFGDHVAFVHALDRTGAVVTLKRTQIDFGYRHARFGTHKDLIITGVDFRLRRGDEKAIRAKIKEVMEYKKKSQPMAERSAGCVFKNPVLINDLPGIAVVGTQVSAGMLIDKAGCKGMKIGCAAVSTVHGNFITATPGGRAADVITLIHQVREKVRATFGVELQTEVVVWGAKV